MIGFDEDTISMSNLSVGRIMINTFSRSFINGWFFFSLGDDGCDVYVHKSRITFCSIPCSIS